VRAGVELVRYEGDGTPRRSKVIAVRARAVYPLAPRPVRVLKCVLMSTQGLKIPYHILLSLKDSP